MKSPKPAAEGEVNDNTQAAQHQTLWDRFRSHPWFAMVPVLGLFLAFFGINLQKVQEILGEILHAQPGRVTVAYSLENERRVRNQGGEIHATNGNNFGKGGSDVYGFISIEKEDVIYFDVPPKLAYLDEGTIALCLTPRGRFQKEKSLSLFRVHKDPKNVTLKVVWQAEGSKAGKRPYLRLRLRWDGEKEKPKVFSEKALDWKANGHYHIAGTWGAAGMKLYVDGRLVGENSAIKRGPKDFKGGKFVINNDDPDVEECANLSNCIISNLQISNYQQNAKEVQANYNALHPTE